MAIPIKKHSISGKCDDGVCEIEIDQSSHTLTTIGHEHHEVHDGRSFAAYFDNTTANSDDDISAIGFITEDGTRWVHLVVSVAASAAAEFFLEEGTTIDDGAGTEATIYNRDRNNTNTSIVKALDASHTFGQITTYTEAQINAANYSVGTVIEYSILVAGEGKKAVGGTARGSQEWILKQNTKYLLRIQNIGASANVHQIHMNFYEHTNKG